MLYIIISCLAAAVNTNYLTLSVHDILLWLTLNFPDLCISPCIYTPYPPLAHAHTHLLCVYAHMCHGVSISATCKHHDVSIAHEIRDIRRFGNCYRISCTLKRVSKGGFLKMSSKMSSLCIISATAFWTLYPSKMMSRYRGKSTSKE